MEMNENLSALEREPALIYDCFDDNYKRDIENGDIDEPMSYALVKEVFDVLGDDVDAIKTYFKLYYGVFSDCYQFDKMMKGIDTLVEKGYLKKRADGKYCFYVSVRNIKSESFGMYYDDWNAETDSLEERENEYILLSL